MRNRHDHQDCTVHRKEIMIVFIRVRYHRSGDELSKSEQLEKAMKPLLLSSFFLEKMAVFSFCRIWKFFIVFRCSFLSLLFFFVLQQPEGKFEKHKKEKRDTLEDVASDETSEGFCMGETRDNYNSISSEFPLFKWWLRVEGPATRKIFIIQKYKPVYASIHVNDNYPGFPLLPFFSLRKKQHGRCY